MPECLRPQSPPRAIAAVVFDLDGTLLDTIDDLTDAMNVTLASRGFPPRTVEECKLLVGSGVEHFLRFALPEDARDDATVDALIPLYRETYGRMWNHKSRPYPGIPDTLASLGSRRCPLAVLSNKPDPTTRQAVVYYFPDTPFADIRGARPHVPLKPDPASALAIATRLGVPPDQVLFVGDTRTDMETAVAAGMVPLGVLWGFRSRDELIASGAARVVAHPAEILSLLFPE
jgi:phosphoglycolate phosphatase